MYKKIYLEITDVCNLSCSFCHKTKREKKFMTEEEFSYLIKKIRPYTGYLYLHLMGEPLLHPLLPVFLKKSADEGFKVTIATNGTLIDRRSEEILACPLYKITFSLHSFEANDMKTDILTYVKNIISFCLKAAENGTICVMRLWNEGGENRLNDTIIGIIKDSFPEFRENRKGYTLADNIYLEFDRKFIWPDVGAEKQKVSFCMGLRDHVGVLCDGSVVPCCLDAEGAVTLGNLFEQDLSEIVASPRARAIYDGFSEGRCTEELCSRCEYAGRFNKRGR